jgi:hypothetical protein
MDTGAIVEAIKLKIEAIVDRKAADLPKNATNHVRALQVTLMITNVTVTKPTDKLGFQSLRFSVEFVVSDYVEDIWTGENALLYASVIGVGVCCILCIGATLARRCCGSGGGSGSTGGNRKRRGGGTAADGLPIDSDNSSSGLNLNTMRSDDL